MKIEYKIIDNKTHLDFLNNQNFDIYVQHPLYGEFNQKLNDEYFCFAAFSKDNVLISSLCILIKAKRGNFIYLPYGPIISESKYLKQFFNKLKELAKEKGCTFIRTSPFIQKETQLAFDFENLGLRESPMHMIAENTCILDLKGKKEDEVLKSMNKNHRNLIRKSLKFKGLTIKVSKDIKDIKTVHSLLVETSKRHSFTPFSLRYLQSEFESFQKIDAGRIYIVLLDDKPIAASIFYQFKKTKVYKHGASLTQFRKVPASYLMQWQSIQDAIKDGIENYNFWGIAPSKDHKDHPFYGITHFKMGFGSNQIDLISAKDLPINSFYWFNWVVETLRRIKRGF